MNAKLESVKKLGDSAVLLGFLFEHRREFIKIGFSAEGEPQPAHSFYAWAELNREFARSVLDAARSVFMGQGVEFPVLGRATGSILSFSRVEVSRTALSIPLVEWAAIHLRDQGDTSLFQRPFELELLAKERLLFAPLIAERGADPLDPDRARHADVPKMRGRASRQATQLDPVDTIRGTALLLEFAEEFERTRAPLSVVHSFRFQPNSGRLWAQGASFGSFQRAASELTQTYSFVVQADIQEFYSQTSRVRLFQSLESRRIRPWVIGRMERFLSGSKRFGLPIGPAFSALLAEGALAVLDDELMSAGVEYIRFHDDFRIGCKSYEEAIARVSLLRTLLVETTGLVLNEDKTKILSAHSSALPQAQWLAALAENNREAEYSDEFDPVPEHDNQLVQAADSLMSRSIESGWHSLLLKTMHALPAEALIARVGSLLRAAKVTWPLARDLARVVAKALAGREERRNQLEREIEGLPELPGTVSDWAHSWFVWMCYFRSDRAVTAIPRKEFNGPLGLREAIIAGALDPETVPDLDPWIRRAKVATGVTKSVAPSEFEDMVGISMSALVAQEGLAASRRGPFL